MRLDLDDSDDFDELQDWIDSFDPQPWFDSDLPRTDPRPVLAAQVDLVAGEFFRATWRRRLADAQGDCGYVARQMRKAGVPLDLALAILLTSDELPPLAQAPIGLTDEAGDEWPSSEAGHRAVARIALHRAALAA